MAVFVIVVLGDEVAVKLWLVVSVEDTVVVCVRLAVVDAVLLPVDVRLDVAEVVTVVAHEDKSTDWFLNTALTTPDSVLAMSSPADDADLKNPCWSHTIPVAPRSERISVARAHAAFSASRRAPMTAPFVFLNAKHWRS